MRTHASKEAARIDHLLQMMDTVIHDKLLRNTSDKLNALIRYHFDSEASHARARLALTAGLALELSENICITLAASCELIHNASLLHDDIQDGDTLRRGKEAAWSHFDPSTAMCAGTLMLSAAFETVAQIDQNPQLLVSHLHQRTADLIRGQTLDLAFSSKPVDLEGYLDIASSKSGSLIALPLELVMMTSHQLDALPIATQAGESFAIAYQIADDLNDVEDDLARGTCNIVGVLQSAHVDRAQASAEALTLMQTHLHLAENYAAQLPAHSGDFLISLCEKLSVEEA
ncbi:MAG: polyprenyl synthetase family protein [Burkholderiales bacterium]|jgi:geranylgeranyl diphosphate synthase, type I|nr:polyprenyl synthetase family protein [Burkholderiales bacterium]